LLCNASVQKLTPCSRRKRKIAVSIGLQNLEITQQMGFSVVKKQAHSRVFGW
jgi:hypothetical protein